MNAFKIHTDLGDLQHVNPWPHLLPQLSHQNCTRTLRLSGPKNRLGELSAKDIFHKSYFFGVEWNIFCLREELFNLSSCKSEKAEGCFGIEAVQV